MHAVTFLSRTGSLLGRFLVVCVVATFVVGFRVNSAYGRPVVNVTVPYVYKEPTKLRPPSEIVLGEDDISARASPSLGALQLHVPGLQVTTVGQRQQYSFMGATSRHVGIAQKAGAGILTSDLRDPVDQNLLSLPDAGQASSVVFVTGSMAALWMDDAPAGFIYLGPHTPRRFYSWGENGSQSTNGSQSIKGFQSLEHSSAARIKTLVTSQPEGATWASVDHNIVQRPVTGGKRTLSLHAQGHVRAAYGKDSRGPGIDPAERTSGTARAGWTRAFDAPVGLLGVGLYSWAISHNSSNDTLGYDGFGFDPQNPSEMISIDRDYMFGRIARETILSQHIQGSTSRFEWAWDTAVHTHQSQTRARDESSFDRSGREHAWSNMLRAEHGKGTSGLRHLWYLVARGHNRFARARQAQWSGADHPSLSQLVGGDHDKIEANRASQTYLIAYGLRPQTERNLAHVQGMPEGVPEGYIPHAGDRFGATLMQDDIKMENIFAWHLGMRTTSSRHAIAKSGESQRQNTGRSRTNVLWGTRARIIRVSNDASFPHKLSQIQKPSQMLHSKPKWQVNLWLDAGSSVLEPSLYEGGFLVAQNFAKPLVAERRTHIQPSLSLDVESKKGTYRMEGAYQWAVHEREFSYASGQLINRRYEVNRSSYWIKAGHEWHQATAKIIVGPIRLKKWHVQANVNPSKRDLRPMQVSGWSLGTRLEGMVGVTNTWRWSLGYLYQGVMQDVRLIKGRFQSADMPPSHRWQLGVGMQSSVEAQNVPQWQLWVNMDGVAGGCGLGTYAQCERLRVSVGLTWEA